MSNLGLSDSERARIPKCDPAATFSVLKSPARVKLVGALAMRGPQIAADLKVFGRGHGSCSAPESFLDSTLKNLKLMVKAGVVVELENPRDRRRTLYALTPLATVTHEEQETVVDFGFCFLRFPATGK